MSIQARRNMAGAVDKRLGLKKKHGGAVDEWSGSKRHSWGGGRAVALERTWLEQEMSVQAQKDTVGAGHERLGSNRYS